MRELRWFFKPTWKKIILTILFLVFMYFIASCFPSGIFEVPSAEEVLQDKSYCRVVRNKFYSYPLNFLAVAFVWFPLFIVFFFIISATKLSCFAIAITIFYFLFSSYFLSCLIIFILKLAKERGKA